LNRFIFLSLLLSACSASREEEKESEELEPPPLIEINTERKDLLYRYMSDGGFSNCNNLEEIPQAQRERVQVIDLSLSPEERRAGRYLQIFDLREEPYKGRLLLREALEAELAGQEPEPPKQAEIIMYSTSWCGVCKRARAFLSEKGLLFVEKDIEKEPTAARELAEKAKRAGVQTGGVPVFDIGGQILSGFDGPRILKAARSQAGG